MPILKYFMQHIENYIRKKLTENIQKLNWILLAL